MFKKTEIYQFPNTIKTYTLLGFPILKKEKSPLKRKYTLLGIKFCQTRKHPLPMPANTLPPQKNTPFTFPKGTENIFYTAPQTRPNNNRHRRLTIFASFSSDGTIHDYVLYYLRELKKISDNIIFIADNPLYPSELNKITPYVCHASCSRHKEYDFGSYKRGYQYAQKQGLLNNINELILCNDSCYGPLHGFKSVFSKMSAKKCDFWGLISNTDFRYHLQSYFLVFRQPVIKSAALEKFLQQVKPEKDFWDVVYNYELKLTEYLKNKGFKASSYLPSIIEKMEAPSVRAGSRNKTVYPLSLIRDHHFPLIKLKCFNNGFTHALQESPIETLNYIKTQSPTLHKVILSDLKKKNLLSNLIENHFPHLLKQAEVVSFDVFDTLLIRPYVKPEDMFLHMERHYKKEGYAQERVAAEARARHNNPHKKEITFNDIYNEILPKYKDMQKKELYFETQILRAHPQNKKLYHQALSAQKTIIATSDMYLPAAVIKKILHQNGYTQIKKIYVSSEYNKTKGSGALFKQILQEMHLKPKKLLHLGDNEISDITTPAALGIKTHYLPKYIDQFFLHYGNHKYKNFYITQQTLESSILTALIATRQLTAQKSSSYWQEIGYALAGPLALGYTQMILKETRQNHLDTLLFVSRDGYILQKIYNRLSPHPVTNHYIYAPRLLTLKCCPHTHLSPAYHAQYFTLLHQALPEIPLPRSAEEYPEVLQKYASQIKSYHTANKAEYQRYLKSKNITGKRIGSVDMTTSAYSSAEFFTTHFSKRYQLGFYSAVFQPSATHKYISYKKELINPQQDEGAIILSELLITAPEYPLKDFINGSPIFHRPTASDKRRIKIMQAVEKGIMSFIEDYTNRFNALSPELPMSVNMSLMRSYINNLTQIDTAELKSISHSADITNQQRENLYEAILHPQAA